MPHKEAIAAAGGGGDGGGTTDYSSLSITTLEFLAAGGDQGAVDELERRGGAGGDTISIDPATGKVIVKNAQGEIVSVTNPVSTPGGGGGSAPAFAGTSAGLAQQAAQDLAFLQEQHNLAIQQGNQEAATSLANAITLAETNLANQTALLENEQAFQTEQAEILAAARLHEARLATARDLVGIRSAEARESRTQGVQLAGQDFGRFIALARGQQAPTGTTPAAAFKQDLAGAANFQAPDLTGLDSNALESVIGKLSQSITPTSPFSGFAHGGTVSPTGRTSGPDGSRAIRVGEAGPEILILRPDGSVEVVPETGSAQFGGEFDLGGFSSLFDSLRRSAGLTGPAFFGEDRIDVRSPLLRTEASQLGAFQRAPGTLLQQNEGTAQGPVFIVDETGRLRPFSTNEAFLQSGFTSADVMGIAGHQLGRFEQGAPISSPFSLPQQQRGSFQAFGQPLSTEFGFRDLAQATPGFSTEEALRVSNLIGFLPAPHKIPASFFQTLLPAEKQALVSAYRLAGVPEADFQHLRTAPQLSFAPQRATAVG